MKFSMTALAAAVMALAAVASAQQAPANDAASFPSTLSSTAPGSGSYLAQYPLIRTIGVEAALGVTGSLGVEHAWGNYWVSARGAAAVAGTHLIGQFDYSGALLNTVLQGNTGATAWGIRDLESDEAANKLWGGQEASQLHEYTYTPGSPGTLTYTTVHTISGAPAGIVRALCRDNTGVFYTASFNSTILKFTISPFVSVAVLPAAGKNHYGLAYDRVNDTIWSFSQDNLLITPPLPAGVDLVEINELDKTTGALTGNGGWSVLHGAAANTHVAGGLDIYENDPLNPGKLSFAALHQYSPDEMNALDLGKFTQAVPTTYCTAKPTSNGCNPAIGWTGTLPNTTSPSGFIVNGTNFMNNKNCLLFYGTTGQAATPYQGGTLCVKTPIKRTPSTNTFGNPPPNDCSGIPQIDMQLFAQGGLGGTPLPALLVSGTVVNCQWWGRDPGFVAPNNTQLSDGLEYTVGP